MCAFAINFLLILQAHQKTAETKFLKIIELGGFLIRSNYSTETDCQIGVVKTTRKLIQDRKKETLGVQ